MPLSKETKPNPTRWKLLVLDRNILYNITEYKKTNLKNSTQKCKHEYTMNPNP